jgi:serine/threonine protein kinase
MIRLLFLAKFHSKYTFMNTFGRYEIKQKLGQGGMATVYLAHDPRFGRDVALKVLPAQFLHDEQFRNRFEREARTIAMLEHPAIVPVYDFGEHEGQPYLVMRYMNGGSLENRLQRGLLPKEETLQVIKRIASALDEAHKKGVVHRDLKPANILFDQYNEPYLSDFGIVKLHEATANLTGNAIVGTPAYMSPEQVHGKADVDGRSDVYSLGVILYEMLVGHVPYKAITPTQQMMAHVLDPVPEILQEKKDLTPAFSTVIKTAMSKEVDTRFKTAGEMAKALEIATGSYPPLTPAEQNDATLAQSFDATVLMPPLTPTPVAQTTPTVSTGGITLEGTLKTGRTIAWWGCVLPTLVGLTLIGLCVVSLVGIGMMLPSATLTPEPSPSSTPTQEATPMPTVTEQAATTPTPVKPDLLFLPLDDSSSVPEIPAEWREDALIYIEEFNQPGLWPEGDLTEELGGEVAVSGQVLEGVYEFHLFKSAGIYWSTPQNYQGQGYYSVDVTFRESQADVGAGLIFMMDDHNGQGGADFYMFVINPNGEALINRCYDNCQEQSPLIKSDWFESDLIKTGLDTTNNLAVLTENGYFQFFINGQVVGEVYDDGFSEGLFGVILTAKEDLDEAVIVHYDNYQVVISE